MEFRHSVPEKDRGNFHPLNVHRSLEEFSCSFKGSFFFFSYMTTDKDEMVMLLHSIIVLLCNGK